MTARTTGRSRTHCAVEFQALPSRIGQVRRIVAAQLRYWRLESLVDAAALGVTELLTNVHRHTGSDKHCSVEIVFRRDHLTVSVRDHDPRLPRVRSAEPAATNGRGLALIAAVSASWGMRAQNDGSGKVVWFTLPVTFGTPPQRASALAGAGPDETALPALAAAAGAGGEPGSTTSGPPPAGRPHTDPGTSAHP
ncbi:ATP-binding protein [Streptomyces sp. WMMB 322]|uniref:ATP-binding protein n=1 Tax=Streptomyces sp. WMMB 322 TaxID=1286821 RepID=UPI000823779B|nr:ATP-binding protein [Streptomyces sp. WMMB 322]SCK57596.1 Anti-sigma regulatory factor (Ser/Thr protein kinase) [Streptomyces sp. WMMB 322]